VGRAAKATVGLDDHVAADQRLVVLQPLWLENDPVLSDVNEIVDRMQSSPLRLAIFFP
jgi:hypothetical protein